MQTQNEGPKMAQSKMWIEMAQSKMWIEMAQLKGEDEMVQIEMGGKDECDEFFSVYLGGSLAGWEKEGGLRMAAAVLLCAFPDVPDRQARV